MLIGAESDQSLMGRAYLILGKNSVSIIANASESDYIFNNDSLSGAFGTELAIGNLIGDPKPDVIISADNWQGGGTGQRVFTFDANQLSAGIVNASDADLIITASGGDYAYFGYPPRVGDINGDGHNDLIVGADHFLVGGIPRLYVFYGDSGLIGAVNADSADQMILGEMEGDLFSMTIEVGDINNDDIDDIITSAYYHSLQPAGTGRIYVFMGGNTLADKTSANQADYVIDNPTGANRLGWWVTSGDINHDGWTEFASSIPSSGYYYIYSLSHLAPRVVLSESNMSTNAGQEIQIHGTATDSDAGNIIKIEYSIDHGSWQNIATSDGSLDSSSENFTLQISSLLAGQHSIEFRAEDSEHALTPASDYATVSVTVAGNTLTILPQTGCDLLEY